MKNYLERPPATMHQVQSQQHQCLVDGKAGDHPGEPKFQPQSCQLVDSTKFQPPLVDSINSGSLSPQARALLRWVDSAQKD